MKNKKVMPVGRQGFTLIELLVVIAIIGLLSTLAVVSLNNARSKARDARRTSDLKALQSALELYRGDQSTDVIPDIVAASNWATLTTALTSYLPAGAPTDPTNTTNYKYTYCANSAKTSYLLGALLETNAAAAGVVATTITGYVAADDCVNSQDATKALPSACNATTGFCLGDASG